MKKNINHIFPVFSPHLSIPIIKSFVSLYQSFPIEQSFFIYGTSHDVVCEKYKDLDNSNIAYEYLSSLSDVVKLVKERKGESFIVHGDAYDILLRLSLINVKYSWVCWGAIPNINITSIKSLINRVRWKFALKRMNTVITLLKTDKDEVNSIYTKARTIIMPYNNVDQLCFEERFQKPYFHTPTRVLLGNNGHCYNSYLQVLQILKKFAGQIEIHVMFQYPNNQEQKNNLRKIGNDIFGSNCFYVDDQMMNRENYYTYISDFDIYICHDLSQTGLGAIYYSSYFGKKLFLNGSNLDWLQYLGAKVYPTSKISDLSFKEFCEPLTEEERLNNKNIILKLWNQKESWAEFLLNKA